MSAPRNVPLAELLRWIEAKLRIDPGGIAAVRRFGTGMRARLVVDLSAGGTVTFDPASGVFDPKTLVHSVVLATGADTPKLGLDDALTIGKAIVWASELVADYDDRAEAGEWSAAYLAVLDVIDLELAQPGAWYGLAEALKVERPDDLGRGIRDSGSGDVYVSLHHFAAFVRRRFGARVDWPAFRSRIQEAGWDVIGQKQVRRPRGRDAERIKVSICRLPAEQFTRALLGDTGGQGDNHRVTPGDRAGAPAGTCPKCDAPWQAPDADGDVSCPNGHWHPEDGAS